MSAADALRRALQSRSEECTTCVFLRKCIEKGHGEPVGVRCGWWVTVKEVRYVSCP